MKKYMKRNVFIILVATLFILVLLYFFNQRLEFLNKEYQDSENGIFVEYPYFYEFEIDGYLDKYLREYILEYEYSGDYLFIDYDIKDIDEVKKLIMYIYGEKDRVIKQEIQEFHIDVDNGVILEVSDFISEVDKEYDGFVQSVVDKNKPMIALTFDDGPNYNTVKVLDILEKYGVRATFFILGCNVSSNEKIIKRMHDLGMEIGNHMYSHKLITKLSDEVIQEEIKIVDDLIFDITGEYPTLLRPSYGTFNKRIREIVDKPIIIWNVDTLDWKYHSSDRITDKVLKRGRDGSIVLMHDIYSATANSLEKLIPELLSRGYQLVTVSELLYYKGIDMESGSVYSRG